MNTKTLTNPRTQLETLACVNERCELYGQAGQQNLTVRKTYGKDAIRYLRCCKCGAEFSDGEASYASLFPEIFGQAYRPSRQGNCGRFPDVRYRIPRTLAHVQIVKHREGQRVVKVDIRYVHGSMRCVQRVQEQLGYNTPNTSAIERRNGTARRMNAHQVRRSLAFSRRDDTKVALGWWSLTVYNWCRPHRALRLPLAESEGKKSSSRALRRWRSGLLTKSGQLGTFCSRPCSPREVRDTLT